ncbi:MAG: FkbM family methyltransferase [Flavobacterium sp.]|uniref:FkbM family methyltransferase n=1 Tax=Flavobacterium sp. TaxID=239 RepID=UPI003BDDC30C
MRQLIVQILLKIYNFYLKKDRLKRLIKIIIGDKKIIITFNGFKIYTSNNSAIESSILFGEYSEQIILDLIKKYANKNYNLIDIGANVGIHSLTAATINNKIEVFSFEPEPSNFLSFIKNIGLNNIENIRPFRMGLGDVVGNNMLNINKGWNKGKHSIKVNFAPNFNERISIPVTKLNAFKDNIIGENFIVKIDVEGFEREVIEGADEIFKKFDNCILIIELITEINDLEICKKIISSLKEKDFEHIYKISNRVDLILVEDYEGSADYIFIKGKDAIESIQNN